MSMTTRDCTPKCRHCDVVHVILLVSSTSSGSCLLGCVAFGAETETVVQHAGCVAVGEVEELEGDALLVGVDAEIAEDCVD